jgi:hypothetical protein
MPVNPRDSGVCQRGLGYADFVDYFQRERDTNAPQWIVAIDLKDLR